MLFAHWLSCVRIPQKLTPQLTLMKNVTLSDIQQGRKQCLFSHWRWTRWTEKSRNESLTWPGILRYQGWSFPNTINNQDSILFSNKFTHKCLIRIVKQISRKNDKIQLKSTWLTLKGKSWWHLPPICIIWSRHQEQQLLQLLYSSRSPGEQALSGWGLSVCTHSELRLMLPEQWAHSEPQETRA